MDLGLLPCTDFKVVVRSIIVLAVPSNKSITVPIQYILRILKIITITFATTVYKSKFSNIKKYKIRKQTK